MKEIDKVRFCKECGRRYYAEGGCPFCGAPVSEDDPARSRAGTALGVVLTAVALAVAVFGTVVLAGVLFGVML